MNGLAKPNRKNWFCKTDEAWKSIVVIGGGGHAKVVISILRKLKRYRILGYTDLKE